MANTPHIRIPSQHIEAFRQICNLDDPEFDSLINMLSEIPEGANRKEFITILSDGLDFQYSREIALAIFSLGNLIVSFLNPDQIVDQLSKSFRTQNSNEFSEEVIDNLIQVFKNRIHRIILQCDSLKPLFEALKIIDDSGNILARTEILSLVHLLHENDFESNHAFQYFRLKVKYRSDGDLNDQSFSLDIEDLNLLKSQIDRALNSAQNFRLVNPNVNLIDISE